MQTFRYSIIYLMALFAFLLIDHYLLPQAPALVWQLQPGVPAGG